MPRLMRVCLFFGLLLAAGIISARADTIGVFQPGQDGDDVFMIWFKGAGFQDITVPIKQTDTPADKAKKIAAAINSAGGVAAVAGTSFAPTVNVLNAYTYQVRNGSAESIAMNLPSLTFSPTAVAIIGVYGTPTGVDTSALPSEFSAAVGFDGLLATADISAASLPALTTAAALRALFDALESDLPNSFQSLLTLNLNQGVITFALPPGETNYIVQTSTNDTGALPTGGFTPAPEPSSFALLGVGLVGLLASGLIPQRARR